MGPSYLLYTTVEVCTDYTTHCDKIMLHWWSSKLEVKTLIEF